MLLRQTYHFAIHFPDFFREPMTKTYRAETSSKAKYLCWLQFRDAYDTTFIEFLKMVKVWKLKDIESTESPSEAAAEGEV